MLPISSIPFAGDIDDDEEILDWLTDPSNMELTEHIEKVNRKMFAKIRQNSENVAVFFCEILKYDKFVGLFYRLQTEIANFCIRLYYKADCF